MIHFKCESGEFAVLGEFPDRSTCRSKRVGIDMFGVSADALHATRDYEYRAACWNTSDQSQVE